MRIALAPSSAPWPLHTPGSITRFDPFFANRTHACPSLVSRTVSSLKAQDSSGIGLARPYPGTPLAAAGGPSAAPRRVLTMIEASVTFRAGRWQFR
jgi:hypothetical protein